MNGLINFIFRRFSCEKCNGCGLIKKSEAKSCGCDGRHFCYKCENSFKNGLYTECDLCHGTGKKIES